MTAKQNGSASAPTLPSRGSNIHRKDINMNEVIDNMGTGETPEEHPWVKARRLNKELSQTLKHCDDGTWFAYTMPPIPHAFIGFGSYPMGTKPDELAIDRVERLAWELSEALSTHDGGRFQAMVLPSNVAGHTVMLTSIKAWDYWKEAPIGRLDKILVEAAAILRDNPDLKIERVTINEHGVHTFHKIPGLRGHAEESP